MVVHVTARRVGYLRDLHNIFDIFLVVSPVAASVLVTWGIVGSKQLYLAQ